MKNPFEDWSILKQQLHAIDKPPFFNEREIWWCSVGMNVGYEVYGKGALFTRPVLIIKKHSAHSFMGVPLSTKCKDHHDYYKIVLNGKDVAVMLGEMRKFDSRRLADKMTKISETKFSDIVNVLCKNFQPR